MVVNEVNDQDNAGGASLETIEEDKPIELDVNVDIPVTGGLMYNLANSWNDFKVSKIFKSADDIAMGIISVTDHWSDIVVLFIWGVSGIPASTLALGAISISLTSFFPIFVYPEFWVKLSMPLGLGMTALIYRTALDDEYESRKELEDFAHDLKKIYIDFKREEMMEGALENMSTTEIQSMARKYLDEEDYQLIWMSTERIERLQDEWNKKKVQIKKLQETKSHTKLKKEERNKISDNLKSLQLEQSTSISDARHTFSTIVSKINGKVLYAHSAKIYKVAESMMESTPQFILQLWVNIKYPDKVSSDIGEWFVYLSLLLSMVSNVYASSQMLFPNGLPQSIYAFALSFFDIIFRCGSFLYLSLCISPLYAMLSIGFTSFCYWTILFTRHFAHLFEDLSRKLSIAFIFSYVTSLSGSMTYFLATTGMGVDKSDVDKIMYYDIVFRSLVGVTSLIIGTAINQEYYKIAIAIISVMIPKLVMLYFINSVFHGSLRDPPKSRFLFILVDASFEIVFWFIIALFSPYGLSMMYLTSIIIYVFTSRQELLIPWAILYFGICAYTGFLQIICYLLCLPCDIVCSSFYLFN